MTSTETVFTVQFLGPDGGIVEHCAEPEGAVVGRTGGDAELQLPGDHALSRRHGRVWREDGQVWYEDLGSVNGSWQNGRRLPGRVALTDGSEVHLGQTRLRLRPSPTAERAQAGSDRGMKISMQGRADKASLTTFSQEATAVELLGLAEFLHSLLGQGGEFVLQTTMERLGESVPSAWRILLVSWPPAEDGTVSFLVEPKQERPKAVSLSLARLVVERGEAMLFRQDDTLLDPSSKQSVIQHGIRTAVYVPLQTPEAGTLGVLCVDSNNPAVPLDAASFHFLRAAGTLLATSLSTERLRQEARRRDMEARENEARREALANFLNIASHDLRNPLTVMRGCGKLVEKLSSEDSVIHLGTVIVGASARAEELINNYLEVSALSDGQPLQLHPGPIELHSFVAEELEFLGHAYPHREPRLLNTVPEDARVTADPRKLRQILGNLVGNAIKYSPQQPVVTVGGERRRGKGWVIWVIDQGLGISPENQVVLFQKFQRVGDRSLVPGTGLGLWLAAALVERHGGSMWVESAEGCGSTFFFNLPDLGPEL